MIIATGRILPLWEKTNSNACVTKEREREKSEELFENSQPKMYAREKKMENRERERED